MSHATEPFEIVWDDQEFYRMLEQDAHTAETRLGLTSVEADLQPPILPPYDEGSPEDYFMLAHAGADEAVQGLPDHQNAPLLRRTATRQFTCNECESKLRSASELERHRNSVHEKLKLFFCYQPGCHRRGRGFTRKDNLVQHLCRVHETTFEDRVQLEDISLGLSLTQGSLSTMPKEKLAELVIHYRREWEKERRRREEAEKELQEVQDRYEQPEAVLRNLSGGN